VEVLPAPRNPASRIIGIGFFVTSSIEEEAVDDTAVVVVMYRFLEKAAAIGICDL
jgi:hypothetical protein